MSYIIELPTKERMEILSTLEKEIEYCFNTKGSVLVLLSAYNRLGGTKVLRQILEPGWIPGQDE